MKVQSFVWVSNLDGDEFAKQVQQRNADYWAQGFHHAHIDHQVTPIDMPGPILMNYSVVIVYEMDYDGP